MVEASTLIVYAGGYLSVVFLSVCLGECTMSRQHELAASLQRVLANPPCNAGRDANPFRHAAAGLYYIAELVEEYTQLTKRIVSWISEVGGHCLWLWASMCCVSPAELCHGTLQVTLLLHAALLFWDKLPLVPVAVSAAAHVTYLQLLRSFPFFRYVRVSLATSRRRHKQCRQSEVFLETKGSHFCIDTGCFPGRGWPRSGSWRRQISRGHGISTIPGTASSARNLLPTWHTCVRPDHVCISMPASIDLPLVSGSCSYQVSVG